MIAFTDMFYGLKFPASTSSGWVKLNGVLERG